jgi:hypothetical protein
MDNLYYGTTDFVTQQFSNRNVLDEIKMSVSAFDCVMADNSGVYCSSDVTTGFKFYYDFLKRNYADSEDALREKLGVAEFSKQQYELIQFNVARGVEFADVLRQRGKVNVIAPGAYFAKGFDQQHYLYLWELVIVKKIKEAWFNQHWFYSNGCTLEYAIATRKGIPRFDYFGNDIPVTNAIELVDAAITRLSKDGFKIDKLQKNLDIIKECN